MRVKDFSSQMAPSKNGLADGKKLVKQCTIDKVFIWSDEKFFFSVEAVVKETFQVTENNWSHDLKLAIGVH